MWTLSEQTLRTFHSSCCSIQLVFFNRISFTWKHQQENRHLRHLHWLLVVWEEKGNHPATWKAETPETPTHIIQHLNNYPTTTVTHLYRPCPGVHHQAVYRKDFGGENMWSGEWLITLLTQEQVLPQVFPANPTRVQGSKTLVGICFLQYWNQTFVCV